MTTTFGARRAAGRRAPGPHSGGVGPPPARGGAGGRPGAANRRGFVGAARHYPEDTEAVQEAKARGLRVCSSTRPGPVKSKTSPSPAAPRRW